MDGSRPGQAGQGLEVRGAKADKQFYDQVRQLGKNWSRGLSALIVDVREVRIVM